MSHIRHPLHTIQQEGSLLSYSIGFMLSLALTLGAYFIIEERMLSRWPAIITISGLAGVQVIVQLVFFLHLGRERGPAWNLMTFLFMVGVLLIVIGGTLWIMYNLDYHMMPRMDEMSPHGGF
jgi:cytochrome o ubiquinol oxidase operon protein cyoD